MRVRNVITLPAPGVESLPGAPSAPPLLGCGSLPSARSETCSKAMSGSQGKGEELHSHTLRRHRPRAPTVFATALDINAGLES